MSVLMAPGGGGCSFVVPVGINQYSWEWSVILDFRITVLFGQTSMLTQLSPSVII